MDLSRKYSYAFSLIKYDLYIYIIRIYCRNLKDLKIMNIYFILASNSSPRRASKSRGNKISFNLNFDKSIIK